MFSRKKYERKYRHQFEGGCTARHWCFEYIKSEEDLREQSKRTKLAMWLLKVNLDTQLLSRIGKLFKRVTHRRREHRKKQRAENNEIDRLAENPSSEISAVGSVYEDFDVERENLETGRKMVMDVESDFDLRLKNQIFALFTPREKGHRRLQPIPDVWETLYEEEMSPKLLFKNTRSSFKMSRDQLSMAEKLKRLWKKFMHHGRSHTVFSKTEFYLVLLLYEFNTSQLVSLGHSFNMGGIVPACVFYILISFFIQMPFNMWILTMVSYTKSLSLKMFSDCMPLVSSIRYPIFLAFLIAESRRLLNLEGMVKFMYKTMIMNEVWKDCTLEPTSKYCVPMSTTSNHNENCTEKRTRDSNYEYFSTQYYVQYNVFVIGNVGDESDDLENWGDPTFRIYGSILAFITFLIASNGIALLKRFTIKFQIFVILLATICVVSVAFNRIYIRDYVFLYSNVSMQFIINFISLCLQINSLPILMWLASMKPPDLSPATCMVIHTGAKFIVLVILSTTYGVLAFNIAKRYKMVTIECFTLEANDIVFTMVPDFFATFRFSKIWQATWLLCVILIAVIYSIYMILAASDSLIQIIPNGDAYATLFMFLVTLIVVGFRLINEFPYFYKALITFEIRGLNFINNFNFGAIVLSIYFLYTPVRFRNEYEFMYGNPPANFWVISWHYMMYIAIIVLVLTLLELVTANTNVIIQYIIAGVFIMCVLWLLVIFCIRSFYVGIKQKTLATLCFPSRKWGPPTKAQRIMQKNLEKTKNLQMKIACKHKCFQNSSKFEECRIYQAQRVSKMDDMKKTAIYVWYVKETVLKAETVHFFNSQLVEE